MSRIPVAVVGATGLAGQQFLASLAGHPLFEIRKLAASSRSAGKKYAQAIRDDMGASRWFCTEPLADEFADIVVEDSANLTTSISSVASVSMCKPYWTQLRRSTA